MHPSHSHYNKGIRFGFAGAQLVLGCRLMVSTEAASPAHFYEKQRRTGLANHASTFPEPGPRTFCPAALGAGGKSLAAALLLSLIPGGITDGSEEPQKNTAA